MHLRAAGGRRDRSDGATQLTGPCYQPFEGEGGAREALLTGSGYAITRKQGFKIAGLRMVKKSPERGPAPVTDGDLRRYRAALS
jgi:hypothetical protein